MNNRDLLLSAATLLPSALMLLAMWRDAAVPTIWMRFRWLASAALASAAANLVLQLSGIAGASSSELPGLALTLPAAWIAVVVQLLGVVIGAFSERYLQGEAHQQRYVAGLAGVLVAVHVLLLADHWLVLIAAWAAISRALRHLLCFYAERPFAQLAAHKKRVADRIADVMLLVAAMTAWHAVGSGSMADLWAHLKAGQTAAALHLSGVCLALAVVLRTALLPVHGWLIQVMEAPTPVSALLHAGVVNLGGYVLIRFAPLLEATPIARWLLVGCGLATAVLAGLVTLTRISVKVKLAWSTVAQMGFMIMECGLGLYTLALLHLMGHSLYKAHAFLAASGAVESARLQMMRGDCTPTLGSLAAAPLATGVLIAALLAAQSPVSSVPAWPWWWTGVLTLAWAPLFWVTKQRHPHAPGATRQMLSGAAMVTALVMAAQLSHVLPFGIANAPDAAAGLVALVGMVLLYLCLALVQVQPARMARLRRWSYAGFYVDEHATRAALGLWPARWGGARTQ